MREPLILHNARIREHQAEEGFTDEDILHAWKNPVGWVETHNGMSMLIGRDARGRHLELGFDDALDYPPPIVHAMLARDGYVRQVKKGRRR